MTAFRKAIVIGASSGIGAELVRLLAERGAKVAAAARREDRLRELAAEFPPAGWDHSRGGSAVAPATSAKGEVYPFVHDVQDFGSVPAMFQEMTKTLGGLDLVIYAAGVMPEVGEREYDFEKDKRIVDVNLLGCIAWMNQAAIRFEGTRSGTMVAIGSVAGDRGRRGQPVYNASKAAVATYMEALRNRLARKGVRVVTIKPGPTATEMTGRLRQKGMMDPRKVAEIVLKKSRKTGEHYVKLSHLLAFYIVKRIPSPIFRRLNI